MNPPLFRRVREDDFERWYERSFDPEGQHLSWKSRLRAEWVGLLKPPALCLLAEEQMAPKPKHRQPLMLARVLFVTEAFYKGLDSVTGVHLNRLAYGNRTADGSKALLTLAEFHKSNQPGRGLHCLISAMDFYGEANHGLRPLLNNQMRFEILKRMEGWYVRSFSACLLHENVILAYERLGFERRRVYEVGAETFTIVTLDTKKAMDSATALSPFFLTPPPRCCFSPRQRHALALLLEDYSQEEACAVLGIARRTLETMCVEIRHKFEGAIQEEAATLRPVLRYLRSHPEEVRAVIPERID